MYDKEPIDFSDMEAVGEYEIGRESEHIVDFKNDEAIRIQINNSGDIRVDVFYANHLDFDEVLWAAVHWCRDYGVYGVNKESINMHTEDGIVRYRLGALYCMANFELTERETSYEKYGERKVI